VLLLAVAFATYLAARLVGTWELYLVAFAFLAAVLVAWLVVTSATRTLRATRILTPAQPTVDDDLVVTVRVTNGSRAPGLLVTLPDAIGGLNARHEVIELEGLAPHGVRVAMTEPQPAMRGVHRLPPLWAETGDPLGLFRARRQLGDPLEVTVYPRLLGLRSCVLFADLGPHRDWGRHALASLGATEFRSIRPHNPGEPLNHVDWKSTAKTGTLMLREMDDPSSGDVTVMLDGTASLVMGEAPRTNYELALQAAGSVADYVLENGRGVTLLLHEREWRQGHIAPDLDGRRLLLDRLAAAAPDARVPLSTSLQWMRSNGGHPLRSQMLILVVLALDVDLVHSLLALRKEGLRIAVIEIDAGSFGAGAAAAPPAAPGAFAEADPGDFTMPLAAETALAVSLAAAGVLCITLRRDDDLRAALSYVHAPSSYAQPV
jgi:uncharacterized protein (DUF58 family)